MLDHGNAGDNVEGFVWKMGLQQVCFDYAKPPRRAPRATSHLVETILFPDPRALVQTGNSPLAMLKQKSWQRRLSGTDIEILKILLEIWF
jgi:hypothetical protein